MSLRYIAALAACSFICTCSSRGASPRRKEALYKGVDFKSFVHVAAIDPKMAKHVTEMLEANGIPSIVEGSVVYGVSVPPKMKAKAVGLLRADSAGKKYYIRF